MTPIRRNISYQFKGKWLRMQVRWESSKRLLIWCGFEIDRTDAKGRPKWDGARCRQNTTHGPLRIPAATINTHLENLERRVADAFLFFEREDRCPSPQELRDVAAPKKTAAPSLSEAFDDFIREGVTLKGWAESTVKSVRNLREILRRFKPGLELRDIDADLFPKLTAHMAERRVSSNSFRRSPGHGYSNATVTKHLRTLKWFTAWAHRRGMIRAIDLKEAAHRPVKTIRQPVIFLDRDELARMECHSPEPGSETEHALDFFLFCCFSGLRYSDAAALLKRHVREDHFDVVTQKTDTPLRIELNAHSRRILQKYARTSSPFALPRITNNRLNHLIKEIARRLGIDSPVASSQYYGTRRVDTTLPKHARLSSHCARRTFICNALALDIPPHVVMKWTGHTEYSSMRPYIDAADAIRREAMSRFDSLTPSSTPSGTPSPSGTPGAPSPSGTPGAPSPSGPNPGSRNTGKTSPSGTNPESRNTGKNDTPDPDTPPSGVSTPGKQPVNNPSTN